MKQQILALEQQILRAKQAYYYGNTPILSDSEYDALEDTLRKLDPKNKVLAIVGAPVQPDNQLKKAKHSLPMGSQEKVHTQEEVEKWVSSKGNPKIHASFKGDGGSIAAYYELGNLKQVITRGDGFIGEDITANAMCFKGLPGKLAEKHNCAVRCEAVLTLEDWKCVDPELKTNPRNVANGILGRLDGKNSQYITALAFDIEGIDVNSEEEKEKVLKELGFTTPVAICGYVGEVTTFRDKTDKARKGEKLNYWIDGIVLKINDLEEQKALGVTNNRPKGQVAWKFEAEGAESKILGITWEVGHTGAITPVAQIQPVKIGGTTISNVSLANPELIKALGLTLNARVWVIKAGDIIPQIYEVLEADHSTPIKLPTKCPVCGGPLTKKKNVDGTETVVLYCENPDCEARIAGKIKRWSKSRDILGLGDSVITALLNAEVIETVADLYTVTPEQMQDLMLGDEKVKLGNKRATAICDEISKKGTEMTLPEFLGSFGTRSLGVRRATTMLEGNPELSNIERWFDGSLKIETFAAKAGVPQSGATIFASLKEQEKTIRDTLRFVTITKVQTTTTGDTYCITGTLPSGRKKAYYKEPLAKTGNTLVDEVTKDLTYLVTADPTVESTKTKKAAKLGVKIISETELQKVIGE